ncbi:hypothetical protein DES45_1232 [Microvirga subterranea]|uniref:Uncharacterized protein n=1 Tax=Microvirga subterranea TaxID=186651 RepID=A0A370H2N7_9HYPH|nr:hypothetical protein DES45_1232 [Microvirga subterranea]
MRLMLVNVTTPFVLIGGLPCQVRQRGGEVDRMLTGPAGNLQNHSCPGQDPLQDDQDRLAVACHLWRRQDCLYVP